jgi:hypothetical protein
MASASGDENFESRLNDYPASASKFSNNQLEHETQNKIQRLAFIEIAL